MRRNQWTILRRGYRVRFPNAVCTSFLSDNQQPPLLRGSSYTEDICFTVMPIGTSQQTKIYASAEASLVIKKKEIKKEQLTTTTNGAEINGTS